MDSAASNVYISKAKLEEYTKQRSAQSGQPLNLIKEEIDEC